MICRETNNKAIGTHRRFMTDATSHDKTLADGKYVRLVDRAGWEFAERKGISGIVVIIPVTDAGELILVEQMRPAVGKPVIELPAGLAGDEAGKENEPLSRAAERELIEETGYEAQEMRFVTRGPPAAGITSEVVTFFVALGLRKVGEGGGVDNEDIRTHVIPLAEVEQWLIDAQSGDVLVDPKVYAGIYFAKQMVQQYRTL
jgi:ADP-ribose pyrophosphatase